MGLATGVRWIQLACTTGKQQANGRRLRCLNAQSVQMTTRRTPIHHCTARFDATGQRPRSVRTYRVDERSHKQATRQSITRPGVTRAPVNRLLKPLSHSFTARFTQSQYNVLLETFLKRGKQQRHGTTGCANKNNPLEKMVYFSHSSMDLSQTFRLFMWVFTQDIVQILSK